jgi:hypothetical protein
MSILKHKGGSFSVTGLDGKSETIHYGPGLHRPCQDCKAPKGKLCVVMKGKHKGNPAHEQHSVRLK